MSEDSLTASPIKLLTSARDIISHFGQCFSLFYKHSKQVKAVITVLYHIKSDKGF